MHVVDGLDHSVSREDLIKKYAAEMIGMGFTEAQVTKIFSKSRIALGPAAAFFAKWLEKTYDAKNIEQALIEYARIKRLIELVREKLQGHYEVHNMTDAFRIVAGACAGLGVKEPVSVRRHLSQMR